MINNNMYVWVKREDMEKLCWDRLALIERVLEEDKKMCDELNEKLDTGTMWNFIKYYAFNTSPDDHHANVVRDAKLRKKLISELLNSLQGFDKVLMPLKKLAELQAKTIAIGQYWSVYEQMNEKSSV